LCTFDGHRIVGAMKCLYINLDSATERRARLEANFQDVRAEGWSLARIDAVNADDVREMGIPGSIRDAEKACFLSHKQALRESLNDDGHVVILEDDVLFGRNTCSTLSRLVAEAEGHLEWDIIFADVVITRLAGMVELLGLRRQLIAEKTTRLLELSQVWFAGAMAYVVNRNAKMKLLRLAEAHTKLDMPYDIFLRQCVHGAAVRGYVAFPFAVSVASVGDVSQLRIDSEKRTETIWLTFRRMIWAESDFRDQLPLIESLSSTIDDEARAYGKLWACMVDPSFAPP
jgi:GR25 family glycosyltransferase involved in LPS biosynthesis